MPYLIPAKEFNEIIDGQRNAIELREVPEDDLKNAVGFTYRWLSTSSATIKVTYLPYGYTVEATVNANLKILKASVHRNPCEFYWMDCICVPQDPSVPEKIKEISNMRTYYRNFKRVAFLGNLVGNALHDGHFELAPVTDCLEILSKAQIEEYAKAPLYTDQNFPASQRDYLEVFVYCHTKLSLRGEELREMLCNSVKIGFSLNEWHERAWTFQEAAVCKEIEFMGLVGTPRDMVKFTMAANSIKNGSKRLTDELLSCFTSGFCNPYFILTTDTKAGLINAVFSERKSFIEEDMFYAFLPVFDEQLVGLNWNVMWEKFRVGYQTELIKSAIKHKKPIVLECINPYWYGLPISKLKTLAKNSYKIKGRYIDDEQSVVVNWKLHEEKVHFKIPSIGQEPHGVININGLLQTYFEEGHVEVTDKWKEFEVTIVPYKWV